MRESSVIKIVHFLGFLTWILCIVMITAIVVNAILLNTMHMDFLLADPLILTIISSIWASAVVLLFVFKMKYRGVLKPKNILHQDCPHCFSSNIHNGRCRDCGYKVNGDQGT